MHKVQAKLKAENILQLNVLRHGLHSLTSWFDTLSATLSTLNSKVSSLDARILIFESTFPSAYLPSLSQICFMNLLNATEVNQMS